MSTKNSSLGDRFVEITVIAVTVVALLAGWACKTSVETRSIAFEADGITAQTPAGWLQAEPAGDEILRTNDFSNAGFGTTYILRKMPLAEGTTAAQIASLLTLERAQNLTAFRVLEQRDVTVYGRTAYEVTYVFVESNPDLTHADIPSVVRGVDYIFINGDHALAATYWAEENDFEMGLGRFHLFLESLTF